MGKTILESIRNIVHGLTYHGFMKFWSEVRKVICITLPCLTFCCKLSAMETAKQQSIFRDISVIVATKC